MANRKQLMANVTNMATKVITDNPMMLARHGIRAEHFAATVREAILANPDIINCTEQSLAKAIRICCRDGIVPDGKFGAIVPMGAEAVAMPMVDGLKQMAYRYLKAEIRSGAIYDGDGRGGHPRCRYHSEHRHPRPGHRHVHRESGRPGRRSVLHAEAAP